MSRDRDRSPGPSRVVTSLLGGLIGALVGVVVAFNLLIFAGIEGGYEASLRDAFDERPAVAIIVVVVIIAFPVVGAIVMLRRRRRRAGSHA